MPDLEALLNEHLSPVHAPRELWERVHLPRERRVECIPRRIGWGVWTCAAAVLVIGSAVGMHAQIGNPAVSQPVQAVRLQAWLKSNVGLDIHGACRLCHEGDSGVY